MGLSYAIFKMAKSAIVNNGSENSEADKLTVKQNIPLKLGTLFQYVMIIYCTKINKVIFSLAMETAFQKWSEKVTSTFLAIFS